MSDALSNLYTDKGPLPLEYTQGPEYDSANPLIGGSMDDARRRYWRWKDDWKRAAGQHTHYYHVKNEH